MDLTDRCKIFHPKAAKEIVFSRAPRIFFRIDHMVDHKTSLSKFKKIKIIPNTSFDHSDMKLEISNWKKAEKSTNRVGIKQHILE